MICQVAQYKKAFFSLSTILQRLIIFYAMKGITLIETIQAGVWKDCLYIIGEKIQLLVSIDPASS